MRLAGRLTAGVALAITVSWALALALAGSTDVLLFLAPALLVAAPLLADPLGGELGDQLLADVAARERRRASASATRAPRAPASWLPRGTRLIAFSLAERPPPGRLLRQI
jgi:hypothetical protein